MHTFITCLIISISLYTLKAEAQPVDAIQFYKISYATVANNYRNTVRNLLSVDERRKLDQINFRFVPSQDIIAQAYNTSDSRRVVEVSFGFLAFMGNLTLAYAITGEADEAQCYFLYLEAAAKVALENKKRRANGQPPSMIPFFPYYVQNRGRGCESISESDLHNPEAYSFTAGGMDSVLAILLGHEIAHHLLGHVDGDGPADLSESRQHEDAADMWAVEHAFAIGINPSVALPLWTFFAAIGGADIGDEIESTHPLGIRRWADALDRILQHMQSSDYIQKFGALPPADVLDDFTRQRDLIRQLVP